MAYYSNEGTPIHIAAAGVGGPGQLRSFRDGSLGKNRDPGPSMAFHDGSLGHGPGKLRAFREGSLGSLGAGPGPSMAFHDGVLGNVGRLRAFQEGSLGQDSSDLPVLDMNDPAVVLEIKLCMASAPFMLGYFPGGILQMPEEFGGPITTEFLEDPSWDKKATIFADTFLKTGMQWSEQQGADATSQELLDSLFVPPAMYPTSLGIALIVNIVMQLPEETQKLILENTPLLGVFYTKTMEVAAGMGTATSQNPEDYGVVIPPADAEVLISSGVNSDKDMLVVGGIVVAGLAALALVFGGGKKKAA